MLAFNKASVALEWALTLQLALLCLAWEPETLSNQLTHEVYDGNQVCVWSQSA